MDDFEHIKHNIEEKAKSEGYELTDKADAIARAKLRFFGRDNWAQCPCDPNSDRACITACSHPKAPPSQDNGIPTEPNINAVSWTPSRTSTYLR